MPNGCESTSPVGRSVRCWDHRTD